MRRIFQKIALLLVVAVMAACGDDQRGEVISQDLSYELDKDYVFVDIPAVFDFNPANILYLKGKTVLKLSGKTDGEKTTIKEGERFEFDIKLKKALDRDMVIRLKEDHDLLDGYQGADGYMAFPEGTVSLPNVTLTKGSKDAKAVLTFQNVNLINEMPGYILPLRLELVDAVEGVVVSSVYYSVFVQMDIEFGKENIDESNDPIEGTCFNDIITFNSDKIRGLENLCDGSTSYSWYPSTTETYLTMTLPSPMKVLGIKINVKNDRYMLGEFNVYANEGKGFISYGQVKRNTKGEPIYVRFKTPVDITAVKFDGMLTINGSTQPDIYEINFIK